MDINREAMHIANIPHMMQMGDLKSIHLSMM